MIRFEEINGRLLPLRIAHSKTSEEIEAGLIEGVKAGGTERRLAEKRIFEHFFYLTRLVQTKYNLSHEDVASVYSDTIIAVIQSIISEKFQGRSSLKTYTYQILMNKSVDVIRKNTTNRTVYNSDVVDKMTAALPDRARTIIQQIIDKCNRSNLTQRLEELGDKCQQLLLLFEDGFSDKEIAKMMEYNSPDVVKTSRLRCLEKLREKVRNQLYD